MNHTIHIHLTDLPFPGEGEFVLEYGETLSLKGSVPPKPEGMSPQEFYGLIAGKVARAANEQGFPLIRWYADSEGAHFLFPFRGGIGPKGVFLEWADPLEEVMTAPEVAKKYKVNQTYVRLALGKQLAPERKARQTEGGTWLFRKDALIFYRPTRNKPRGKRKKQDNQEQEGREG